MSMIYAPTTEHIDLTAVDLTHEKFDALPDKQKKAWRDRVVDAIAAHLFEIETNAQSNFIEAQRLREIRDQKKRDEVSRHADYLNSLTLTGVENLTRFFGGLNCDVSFFNPKSGSFDQSYSNVLQSVNQIASVAPVRFMVSFRKPGVVALIGKAGEVERICGKHGFPKTTTATDAAGNMVRLFSTQYGTKAPRYDGPGYRFAYTLDIGPGWTFGEPMVDPETGTLPELPHKVDLWLSDFDANPKNLFQMLEA